MADIIERLGQVGRALYTDQDRDTVAEAMTIIQSQAMVEPRKGVTAWEIEPLEENGDDFFVLTFHHGLGKTTRLDLWPEEVRDLARYLEASMSKT